MCRGVSFGSGGGGTTVSILRKLLGVLIRNAARPFVAEAACVPRVGEAGIEL